MGGIPWTKFQDFYLRYGFLKVAVAALDPDRRSVGLPVLLRRISNPLFPITRRPNPLERRRRATKEERGSPVVERLLRSGDCPSLLYAITASTSYKIADWARDVSFLGRGNQITERGLLLRKYQDSAAAEAFLAGDLDAWNPFPVADDERWFLLYHLLEVDPITGLLIDALAEREPGSVLETIDAARLFCRAFVSALTHAEAGIQLRDIPEYRTARALAHAIAEELDLVEDLRDLAPWLADVPHSGRAPKPANSRAGARKTHKNADHQTIPRFEQLVDLGLVCKPAPEGDSTQESARKRWRYLPTQLCRSWAEVRRGCGEPFAWEGFGRAVVQARSGGGSVTIARENSPTPETVSAAARYLMLAFEKVGRPVGMTPFDSVGLRAMLDAALKGHVVEMGFSNRMLLAIKRSGAAAGTVFFASGNAVDQMFVQLRPGFVEGVVSSADVIAGEMRAT